MFSKLADSVFIIIHRHTFSTTLILVAECDNKLLNGTVKIGRLCGAAEFLFMNVLNSVFKPT
jgi:hypothetical protein